MNRDASLPTAAGLPSGPSRRHAPDGSPPVSPWPSLSRFSPSSWSWSSWCAASPAATAGIAVDDGMVFSAVGSVAGFLSAPGATDRGVISALAPPALRGVGVAHPAFRQRAARDRAQPDEARERRAVRATRPRRRARCLVVPNASVAVRSADPRTPPPPASPPGARPATCPRAARRARRPSSSANSSWSVRRQRHRRERETRRARERLDRDLQRLHRRESIVGLGRQRAQHDLGQRGRVGAHRLGPRRRAGPCRSRSGSGCRARWRPRTARCPWSARRGSRRARRCRCAGRRAGRGTARATCTRTCPSASLPACACAERPTSRCRSRRPSRRRRRRPARSTATRRGARCRAARRPGPAARARSAGPGARPRRSSTACAKRQRRAGLVHVARARVALRAQHLAHVRAVHVLHREERRVGLGADVVDLDDVRVVERRRQPRLVEEHAQQLGIERVLRQDPLEHDQLLEAFDADAGQRARKISAMPPTARRRIG